MTGQQDQDSSDRPTASSAKGTLGAARSKAKQTANKLDATQQNHSPLGFPVAVYRKYSEDQAGNLANLIAYWAFFSLFPLLLVAITILELVGIGEGTFKHTLSSFPLIKDSIKNERGLSGGNPVALIIGVAVALWAGLAVFKTVQTAFDSIWEVPMTDRPGFADKLVRSLKALVVLGIGFIVTLALSGIATGGGAISVKLPVVLRLLVGLLAIGLDIVGFCLAYSFLTKRDLTYRQVLPGAVFAGVLFFLLQLAGTALVSHGAHGHTGATSAIALVLGMLWWFSLQAQVTLYGAEINVVVVEKLWPRGLVDAPDTNADKRAYQAYAEEKTYRPHESVDTTFHEGLPDDQRPAGTGDWRRDRQR